MRQRLTPEEVGTSHGRPISERRFRSNDGRRLPMSGGQDEPRRPETEPRVGQGDVKLSREEFYRRLRERFADPAFDAVESEIEQVIAVAWESYDEYRKSPRTRRAGPEFANPDYELSVDWLDTRARIQEAERARQASGAAT